MSFTDLLTVLILTVSGLFILYNLALLIFPSVRFKSYDPIERCEEYVYNGKDYEQVFVGSGLVGQLENELPEDAFNLCFPYFGGCTGLEIIVLSKKIPNTVFIETNYIFKGSNKKLIRKIFGPGWKKIKYVVPFFLRKNQPGKLVKTIAGNLFRKQNSKTSKPENAMFDDEALARFIRIYNDDPETEKFENMLLKMEKHVNEIYAQGCRIVLFEMPIHQSLYHSKLFKYQRMRLKEVFDNEKYQWISGEETHDYETVDGIHLTTEGITRYTKNLLQEVKTVLN
jgi:hypothetical protein